MLRSTISSFALAASLLAVLCASTSCGGDKGAEPAGGAAKSDVPASYWAATAPAGAVDVTAARKDVADGSVLTVIGLVQDYRDGQAQFFLADRALVPCDERANDSCPTPWDYCCEDKDKLRAGLMTVELRDGKKLRKASLAGFHGFDRLKEAVVTGEAEVDASGNLVLVANAIHVREPQGRKKAK